MTSFFDVQNTVSPFNDSAPAGNISGDATVTVTAGDISSQGNLEFAVLNNDYRFLSTGGTIGGDASVFVTANSISTGGFFQPLVNNTNGTIGGSAAVTVGVTGDISVGANTFFNILNTGGDIGGDALSNLTAVNFSTGSTFNFQILNESGNIGGSALLTAALSGSLTSAGDAFIQITNGDGTIGSDAAINMNAVNISTGGSLFATIFNTVGNIGGSANITFDLTGDLTTTGDANFLIDNFGDVEFGGGGTIGGDAVISVAVANISARSFLAQIDNSNGGTIVGNATIDMNVSGSATVTSDATVQILGSDDAATAAINLDGGSYDAGGTFLALIDGDGAVTFNNASVHADVLKVGALGTNGVLNIGGGSLSADTTLKLYAPGSNGAVNFTANVTLSSETNVLIAANTVTINNGIVVTIAGDDGADAFVFTNVPNYTGSGGNDSATGMFAGNGAQTLPLDQAPPFDDLGAPDAPAKNSTTSVGTTAPIPTTNPDLPENRGSGGADPIIPRSRPRVAIARVADSNELLDLADKMTSGPIETGHHRSNAPADKTSRGPASASSRKGPLLTPTANVASAKLTFIPSGDRRPVSPP